MRWNRASFTSTLAAAAVVVPLLVACVGSASAPQATTVPSLPIVPATVMPARGELEAVLGDAMVNDPTALCEWDVWGETVRTLYLWAVCESTGGTAMSAPAVVHLDADGHVTGASLPGDGTRYGHDVRKLFPPHLQRRIYAHEYDAVAAMERIAERRRSGGFAIYLVDEAITAQEMLQVDVGELRLEETPIISLDDLVAYDATTHEIQLADSAFGRLGALDVPVHGLPFVVCAGSERIYGGAFWVSYSSVSYEGIVIDIFPALANDPGRTLRIQLGYPESLELFVGEDLRSHPRILESLEAVNELR